MPRTEHPFDRQARRRIILNERARAARGKNHRAQPSQRAKLEEWLGREEDDYATPETSIDFDPRYLEEE